MDKLKDIKILGMVKDTRNILINKPLEVVKITNN
jgi:hypothetical protein